METFKEIRLSNGLLLIISDRSRHYFGGFYHVRLTVSCDVHLGAEHFNDLHEYQSAKTILGGVARFEKELERMGVHPDALEATRIEMVQSFLDHSLAYISDPGFPRRLVDTTIKRKTRRSPVGCRQ